MAVAIVNGKRVRIPSPTTDDQIRQVGGIPRGRTLIRQDETGNYVIPPGTRVDVDDDDVFVDAPSRTKG